MFRLSAWLIFALVESSTMIEAEKVPETAGVPLIVPPVLTESPLGSPDADQV